MNAEEKKKLFEELYTAMEKPRPYQPPVGAFGTGLLALDIVTGGMKPGQLVVLGGDDDDVVHRLAVDFLLRSLRDMRGAVWLSEKQSVCDMSMDVAASSMRVPRNVLLRNEFTESVKYILDTMMLVPLLLVALKGRREPSVRDVLADLGHAKGLLPRLVLVEGVEGMWLGESIGEKLARLKGFAVSCEVPVVVPVHVDDRPEKVKVFDEEVVEAADLLIGVERDSCVAALHVLKGAEGDFLGRHTVGEFVWNGFIEDEDNTPGDVKLVTYE